MPLASEYEQLLKAMGEAGILEPLAGFSADEVRARMQLLESARNNDDVQVFSETDQSIKTTECDLPARIYKPNDAPKLPVVVYFHGGGFVFGGLNSHAHVCKELCIRTGAIVVSVDYRLVPEHPFPAAVNDAYAAVCWIAENAETFGGDGSRIAVAGDSAGANLATVASIRCRDEGGPKLSFQLLVYPGTHIGGSYPSLEENADGYFLTQEALDWFYGHYFTSKDDWGDPWASPVLTKNLASLPPALLITAEYDPIRDEGEAYAKRLSEAGTPTTLQRYDGAIHGFFGASTAIGERAVQAASEYLTAALFGDSATITDTV